MSECEIQCGAECEWIFERVKVHPRIIGETLVDWTLHPRFIDPPPHTFQLQVGMTGNPYADDWTNVGAPVVDTFYAIDDTPRVRGKTQWTHYRVLLTSSNGTYASRPQHSLGNLPKRDWLEVRDIIRKEDLRLRKKAGQKGFLLKRRLSGTYCSCLDVMTMESRNPKCASCYGTGIVGGYYEPYPCFFIEAQLKGINNHLEDQSNLGTVDPAPVIRARMLNYPQVFSRDVWVDYDTDFRWYIRDIKNLVERRGVPVVLNSEIRLAPYSDIIYTFPIVRS